MYEPTLLPCYLEAFFLRGVDHVVSDGAMSRIATLERIHDTLIGHEHQDVLMPYVGAIFLVALMPYCSTHDYNHEPAELLPMIIRSLRPSLERQAHDIVSSWRLSCPRDYVLLPEAVIAAAYQVQADTWEREIDGFYLANIRGEPIFDEIIDHVGRLQTVNSRRTELCQDLRH